MSNLYYWSAVTILLTLFQSQLVTGAPRTGDIDSTLRQWWTTFSTSYPKYKQTTAILSEMQKLFPNLIKLYSIGKTVNGLEMWVINIAENVNKPRPLLRPMVKLVANMHGDETLGRALCLMLTVHFLDNYRKKDTRVTKLLSSTDLHFLFSVNPDGFEASVEGTCISPSDVGRANQNGVDLNRNFPDQFYKQDTPKPEPETVNIMKWIKENPFVLSGNLHGGAVVASYPFDSISMDTVKNIKDYSNTGVASVSPDESVFSYLATTYSKLHKEMHLGQVRDTKSCISDSSSFPGGVTNGAKWYNVIGGMQDFNYVNSNCFEITFELSCCKYPKASQLLVEWNNNQEALMQFLESAQMGVKGIVKGLPLGAKVTVEGINHPIIATKRGEYWRLLVPGKYKISIEGLGPVYNQVTFPSVRVNNTKSPVILNHTFT